MAILKKITKLKNLGVYTDFSWGDLPEFKQYNVIYGWNGTGKTTLSKMLGSLNTGSLPEFTTLEYSILDDEGNTHSQGSKFSTPVRVFNGDFIAKNVDFDALSSKTITVVLGEENKEALEAIKVDEKKLSEVISDISKKVTAKRTKESTHSTAFTDIARTISQGTQGAIVRNYNKTNAETAFRAMGGKELLSEAELATVSKSVAQDTMPKLAELSLAGIDKTLADTISEAKTILGRTVEATIIARLKDNPDISGWVEIGLAVHKKHGSKACEFCGQALDASRISDLTAHFNEADAKLKADVDILADTLRRLYSSIDGIQAVDKANVYKEYQDNYEAGCIDFLERKKTALEAIAKFGELVNSKKAHTTEALPVSEKPSLDSLSESLASLNGVIVEHNKKTDEFDVRRKVDSQKIERHHLSNIYDTVKTLEGDIKVLSDEITSLNDDENIGKKAIETRLTENRAKISSSHKACEMLCTDIKKFLGHSEITFRVNADETGYDILRNGDRAKSLSEGERTGIAFVFFITHLKEEGFDPKTGVIVVDDPVSSLDANSQFQAFAFLKEATKEANQLFLFTHNFDFLKLVLFWVNRNKNKRSVFMINNPISIEDGSRTGASLVRLDPSLEKFESEYHYLFNLVYAYGNGDGTVATAYAMPNIARKLLDSYLMFRVPKSVETYARLQELNFDEEKKTAIYKFTNDQSHITGSGFDPSLVPETQKCLRYILELMEATFPEHYTYLKEAVS
jgi:wobble nucleotide-excising tRNase